MRPGRVGLKPGALHCLWDVERGHGRAHALGCRRSESRIIVANASGTEMTAGWVRIAPIADSSETSPIRPGGDHAGGDTRADDHAGRGGAGGQARPPDPEQQQRAERARGEREGPADEHEMSTSRVASASSAGATMPATAATRKRARRRARAREDVVADRAGDSHQQAGRGRHERGERARGDDRGEDVAGQAGPGGGGDAQHDGVGVAGGVELGRERAAEQAIHAGEQVEGAEQAEHAHGGSSRRRAVRVRVEADEDVRQSHRAQERRQQQAVDQQR